MDKVKHLESTDAPIESIELTQEELDHINRITMMAMELEGDFKTHTLSEADSDKEHGRVFASEEVPIQLIDKDLDKSSEVTEVRDNNNVKQFKSTIDNAPMNSMGLTQEEIDHINRINMMAMQEEGDYGAHTFSYGVSDKKHSEVFAPEKVTAQIVANEERDIDNLKQSESTVAQVSMSSMELTQEEIDHINKIAMMALQEEGDYATHALRYASSEEKRGGVFAPEEMPIQIIGKDLDQSTKETQVKDIDDIGQSVSTVGDVPMDSMGLTQEEIDHINRINMMAMQEEGDYGTGTLPYAISGEKHGEVFAPEKASAQIVASDLDQSIRVTKGKDIDEIRQSKSTVAHASMDSMELTQEEIDHIDRIAVMAMQEEVGYGTTLKSSTVTRRDVDHIGYDRLLTWSDGKYPAHKSAIENTNIDGVLEEPPQIDENVLTSVLISNEPIELSKDSLYSVNVSTEQSDMFGDFEKETRQKHLDDSEMIVEPTENELDYIAKISEDVHDVGKSQGECEATVLPIKLEEHEVHSTELSPTDGVEAAMDDSRGEAYGGETSDRFEFGSIPGMINAANISELCDEQPYTVEESVTDETENLSASPAGENDSA
ncbi:hypothetical protein KIN20_022704 [Parelaphostrongylus tenuis]|uniref:Uncharacterized protein n=1 Tax=Parelaphostrongylus tenuis TaxID=148309 RepID=A0AAD5QWY7_PARTN|nr:hypothetical protein KIN20_022704 [Parelaphostrongylus tenuis]